MNRKRLIVYSIMVMIPIIFLLILLAFISFPLMLLGILGFIVLLGLFNRRKPEILATLFNKNGEPAVLISRPHEPIHYPRAKKAYLELISGNASREQNITMDNAIFTIGRDPSCNAVLTDPLIGRRHLTIEYNENDSICYIRDHSTNGTYLNNTRLKVNQPYPLKTGDVLLIVNSMFTVEYAHY